MGNAKFGHINIHNVFDLLPEKDYVKNEIADFVKSMESQLFDLHNEIDKKEEELASLSNTRSKKKKEKLENELLSLQERVDNFQRNAIGILKEKEAAILEPFLLKIKDAIKIVGEEKGLTYVFDSNSLLFFSNESIDITPDVISILNLVENKETKEFLN